MKEVISKINNSYKIMPRPSLFSGSICVCGQFNTKTKRAELLEKIKINPSALREKKVISTDPKRDFIHAKELENIIERGKSKVLLFRNIFNSPDKEQNRWVSPGVHYLASSLKNSGFRVIFSDSKISLNHKEFITEKVVLENILRENADLNFIGIPICEDFFEKAGELIKFMRSRTKAFIGVGGVMPTLSPEHVFVHLPEVNFLVRGAGEEIFPELVKILDGNFFDSELNKAQIERLLKLNGFIFKNNHLFISNQLNKINWPDNYDHSSLDFSFIERENLTEGLNLFTSRGCFNNCFFCTTPGRGRYFAKSFQNLKKVFNDYEKRLREIFKGSIPNYALKVSFNDDDFLADFKRAKSFFSFLKFTPLRINFFQTGINSFFKKTKSGYSNVVNRVLIRHLPISKFSSNRKNIYIGTENFCNAELMRLNKGYKFSKIKKVVRALSEKKIHQVHHLIASNQLTAPEEILDNLIKIATFQILYGDYFKILVPFSPYLVSLYPSVSYRVAILNKREKFLNIERLLSIRGYPEYDYPLVKNDIPINKITRALIPILYKLFLDHKDYLQILDLALMYLLFLREKYPSKSKEIDLLIDKYRDYPQLICKKTRYKIKNDRNNLQLMITRRCHLRCRYCPIVKKNFDMDEDILYKAIDLLFTSARDRLRLDFTGGEPLLRFDLIRKAVEYAKKISQKKDKEISFYLVTNLIALNDEIADFLAQENFFLELSLDGEEKYHNFYKISARHKINPYRSTVSRLRKVFLRKINNYAVMVVTSDTVRYLSRNFRHLLKVGFRHIGINYAFGSIWNSNDQKELFRQFNLIREKYYQFIEKGVIKLSNLESRLEPAVLNSEIMVDTDGLIYYLTDWLFENKAKKIIPPLGQVNKFNNLNDIILTKFYSLNRLFKHYPTRKIKKIIINNIELGNSIKEYFEKWRER